ncbi:hypothetical protein [Thalassoroseus pseudoceratinae]|uniref:hypothetical protein n=1 Tax=Thalassoroseus pseudoceratinae TaxID=2713176 RepID=UPI0014223678|nr:hypothetical protein [Thalassoroseus pseudoceratinae]
MDDRTRALTVDHDRGDFRQFGNPIDQRIRLRFRCGFGTANEQDGKQNYMHGRFSLSKSEGNRKQGKPARILFEINATNLLNDPPLKHASKPDSVYKNDHASYRATVDLVVRARLTGEIPMNAIGDETRPVINWKVDNEIGSFVRRELDGFLKRYWRDVMQSQPNHIEIVGEKNTVAPILEKVAMKYRLPLTTGRGYCSLPPRFEMAERFRKSGKSKLVLLIVSDFDPDGEEIAHSFARSMRDDFGIESIHPVKVALTAEQAAKRNLPPNNDAKRSSPNYKKFFKRHQTPNAYELEALQPTDLQQILADAIDAVIDTEAFNEELRAEEADATELARTRQLVHRAITALDLE